MSLATTRLPSGSRLLDAVLALLGLVFLCLYVTDAVLALRPHLPFLDMPVEMFVVMLAPIALRVHLPDLRRYRLAYSLALWRDHRHVLVPFLVLIALAFLTAMQPGANLAYGQGKELFILGYRFLMLAGGLSVAIFLLRIGWRPVLLVVLLTLAGSIFYDLAYPGVLSQLTSRAGGFQQNPNLAAIATVMLTAVVLRYDRIHAADLPVLLVSFIATFSTLSRGGMLQFALLAANYLYLTGRGNPLRQLVLAPLAALGLVVLAAATIGFLTSSSTMFDDENAQRRLATFSGDSDTVYETDDVRLNLIPQYLELIGERPLLGHGAGFSRSMPFGPHNTYLNFWVNNGFFALAAYVWMLCAMLAMSWSRRFMPGVVFAQIAVLAGFFSHNVIQLPVFLITAGLVMGLSWGHALERVLRRRRAAATRPVPPGAAPAAPA